MNKGEKMKIGIDIDGVLTDIARFIVDYGIKFSYENNIDYKIKEDEYDEAKALGITEEQSIKFWNTYLEHYARNYPAREFASEVISKLKQNNEIYIITARNEDGLPPETYGTMKQMVYKWLEDNHIQYDKLIFTVGSKLPYCLENKIDVMIDDSPTNILDISSKIPVFCFDNPYNKKMNGKNITRVYTWHDILNKINMMQEN